MPDTPKETGSPVQNPLLLSMQGICKAFDDVEVLHAVGFELRTGEIHALVGENGAGKSTLMKVLAGVYPDASGRVLLNGKRVRFQSAGEAMRAGVSMIHQELNLVEGLTVAENIYLGREPRQFGIAVDCRTMNRMSREILRELGSEIDPAARVASLRIGDRQMIEIAKALSFEPRVLVMDEPTSALSASEISRLFEVVRRLARRGVGIVYVSHRFEEIFDLADRVSVLRDGRHVGTMPVAGTSRDELIRVMVGRPLNRFFTRHRQPRERVVFEVRDLCLGERGPSRTRARLESVSFDVREGEILGIAGLMGAGRSELLESLFGAHGRRVSGTVRLEGKPVSPASPADAIGNGIALVTEDRKRTGLVLGMSVRNNLSLAALPRTLRWGMLSARRESLLARSSIERLSIRCRDDRQDVAMLSGGNQQKVVLGKWLAGEPRVLLLDEPTRGIDVGAKAELYRLLAEWAERGCAVVLASSELPELLNLCDRVLVMREGKIAAAFRHDEATQERILDAAAPLARSEAKAS